MKELIKSKIIDKNCITEIIKERNLLSKLNHPFIVNMHFSFQDNDSLYMILDLKKGGDLRYYHIKQKKFNENECHLMASCLLLGMEYIHTNKIIHRDIKPENIVIDQCGYFYITDFGIAKNLNDNEKDTKFAGSLGYIAPEVLYGEKYGYGVDYFALGAICYEMIMGKLPYDKKNIKEMKELMMASQVQIKNFEIPNDWSKDAIDFTNKLIQRNQNKRLGYNGIAEIKNHPWMKNTDWEKLYLKELKSPFIPIINREQINSNLSDNKIDETTNATMERCNNIIKSDDYKFKFEDFYYFNKYSMKNMKETVHFINPHSNFEKQKEEIDNNSSPTNKKKHSNSVGFKQNYNNSNFRYNSNSINTGK